MEMLSGDAGLKASTKSPNERCHVKLYSLCPRPPYLLLSASFGYLFLMFGFFGIAMSHNVVTMCISIMVRSFGSSVLWVYSTLLIQLRVPDRLLGRVLAMEIAFFTVRPPDSKQVNSCT